LRLADTSAWVVSRRTDQPDLRAWFDGDLVDGEIATCDMVKLELLYSARNRHELDALAAELDALPDCPVEKPQWRRALEVYAALAAQGGAHQRQVKHADLLIAAAAESAGVEVLHYDEDYERIAAVTGQPHRWVASRGSV
jgi:predicted nucleic acid-binding protein